MKYYIYLLTQSELKIIKKRWRLVIEKIYLGIYIFVLSISISVVIYFSVTGNLSIHWKLICFVLFLMAVLTFFFRHFFKRRDTYLVIKDDILICNGKAIGEIKFIDSLIIEEYVSADAITGIKKIELIYNRKNVEIMSGVNESDCLEIVELIKKFLALPELNIISNIR